MGKKATGFLEKNLLAVVQTLRDAIISDRIASRNGFLQSCDPRVKLVCIALALCAVLLARHSSSIGLLYLTCLVLVAASSISLSFFIMRTVLFIPLFAFFIALPALFSPITPGDPVFIFSPEIAITKQGIDTAVMFCLRVLTSVSFAVLMVLTTPHHALLKALRVFRVPAIFVMTLNMTYRYIFILLDIILHTFIAIKSRVGVVSSGRTGRNIIAMNMAGLWLRSYRMHHQVYDAMVSRGFYGEPVTLTDFRFHARDLLFISWALASLSGTLWLNRYIP
jgi:cobalt/nickel transport system permease protein